MKKMKTAGISILLAACAACLSLAFVACTGGEKNANYGAGEEGFYYYDGADSARYMLSLQSGNYMITASGSAAYSGSYDYDEESGEISFTGDATFTAAMSENALSLEMADTGYSFKAYRYFDVTYVDESGKTVATESVLNGQSAPKIDAEKDGYWFIGWYEDANNSSEFAFDTSIAGDTTVYGWYIEKNLTATEYEITLDYGNGTTETVSTMNGAVWTLPTDGVLGWWVSATNKSEELTYKYETGTAFTSDTTLFAVYSGIGASVTGSGITWDTSLAGANVSITIADENGETVVSASNLSSSSGSYTSADFTALGTGTYTVTVGSDTMTYVVNGLDRVSASSIDIVVNGDGRVITFAPVENATRYEITVTDGERTVTESLGSRTYYNISGWDMTKEGLTFTVTAYADGYVSSVSDAYNYLLALDKVTIEIDGENVVWNRVDNALEYEVIIYGKDDVVIESFYTTDNSYSLKYYDAGTYTISVQPVTGGYWSEETKYSGYAKSTLASPVITSVTDYSVTWDPVTGAASYVVSVNGTETEVTEGTTFYITDKASGSYEIAVKAVETNGNDSSYSDSVVATNGAFSSAVSYGRNTVSWNYDVSATSYKISVNGDEKYTVGGTNSQEIELTKVGDNDIVVTAYNGSEAIGQASLTVYAYSVTLDGNGLTTEKTVVYVAQGDTLKLGGVSGEILDHADFMGWYTQADYTEGQSDTYGGNGSLVLDGSTFTGNRNTYLYAYYSYEYVDVTLVVGMGLVENGDGEKVDTIVVPIKYNSTSYALPVPTPNNAEDAFDGWYTRANGYGTKYASADGAFTTAFEGETTLYAYYLAVLYYSRTTYGGKTVYAVSAGSTIDFVTNVTVPEKYTVNGTEYDLVINSGAFESCKSLVSISIPDTVLYIATTADGYNSGTGAFSGCSSLEAVNIYATGDAVEPLYFSADGVLFHKMNGTENVELLYFPYAKELSTYTVPSYVSNSEVLDASDVPVQYAVTEIPYRVFRERKMNEIVIPSTVTYVGGQAFYNSTRLQKVTFAGGEGETLTLGDELFRLCTNLTEVTLPARYTEFSTAAFDYATSLISVYFEDGGSYKSTTSGVVLDAAETTVVYYPLGIGGAVDFTTGDFSAVTTVGSSAFADNKNITSITISGNVTLIKESAFDGCSSVSSLEFKGDADSYDLTISARAFYGLTLLREVSLPVNLTTMEADAFGGCTNLTSVYFDARTNTQTLNFADGAFGSSSAVTELTLGVNVPEISFAEIFGGSRLAKVTIETATDSDTGETIYNENYFSDDYGVVYNAAKTSVLYYPLARVGEYELLDTTTEITSNVFSSRTGLTAITIPASVNTIADDAFSGCTYLETITVQEGNENYCSDSYGILYQIIKDSEEDVTKLSDDATALRLVCCPLAVKYDTLEIEENVIRVAAKAFDGNTVVKSVTFKATTSFEFETAPYNGSTTDFRAYTFNSCTALETVVLPDCMTEISAYAFYYCSALKYVNIPKSCVTIGNSAFRQNKGTTLTGDLTDSENGIVLPEGLQTIEAFAFYYNMHLAVTIPYTVTFIGQQAFGYCWDDTTTQVEIVFQETPEGIDPVDLTLDQYALDYTQYATSVTIPARTVEMGAAVFMAYGQSTTESTVYFEDGFNLTSIGNNVFNAAKSLKTITIPASVTAIEQRAFYNCTALESVYFAPEGETTSVTTIGNNAFYQTALKSVEIPASVTSIDYNSFGKITALESVTFEANSKLETIGYGAFYGDTALKTITIPGSVTTINSNSNTTSIFYNCTGLETVVFETAATGAGLTVLPYSAFKGCTALTTVTLPDTLLTIGDTSKSDGAFEGCTSLKEITIPSKVETIAPYTFNGCTSLETVTFESPSSVSSIGNYAFNGCTAMTSFTFPEGDGIEISLGEKLFSGSGVTTVTLTSSVTQLGGAFVDSAITSVDIGTCTSYIVDTTMQVVCSTDKKEISYVLGTITGEVEVPDTVEVIGPSAYSDQTGITSVRIPASVKTISDYAFYGCTSLVTVEIASGSALGEDALGASAFEGCTALTSINLPATVTVIPDSCFKNCDLSMTTVPSAVTEVGSEAFRGTKITSITLSAVTSVGTYAFADTTALGSVTFGNSLTTLGSYAFDNSTALESVNFPTSLTKIDSYTFHGCASLTDIEIPSNITSIGTYAFSECTGLVSITLPDSLSTLDTYVFRDSTALVSVTIPEGITTLNSGMFWGCSSLEEVILPDGITKIDTYAFYLCESLKTLALPAALTTISDFAFEDSGIETIEFGDALTSIGNYAFLDCPNLLSVLVGRNVTTLGSSVFQRCTALVSANTGDSVTTVNGFMFDGCTSLVSVEFGPAVTSIGSSVLRNCTSLESVTIHNGVTDIGSNAFLGCSSLESIYIPSSVSSVGSGAFDGCSCDVFVENTMNYVTSVWTSDWMGTGTGKVYYYSETEPAFNESGTGYADTTYIWWHYDEDENIVIWAFGYTTYKVETEGYVLYDADADAIAYVCLYDESTGTSTVYAVTECSGDDDGYTVTLENGGSYTIVLSETTTTVTAA